MIDFLRSRLHISTAIALWTAPTRTVVTLRPVVTMAALSECCNYNLCISTIPLCSLLPYGEGLNLVYICQCHEYLLLMKRSKKHWLRRRNFS
ncbi:hypothetical protein BJ912DRAFT_287915 [Pholiota molesta]|nr:hypothetical protein BJ912DRAFT_287915 [Pholiota molesta]